MALIPTPNPYDKEFSGFQWQRWFAEVRDFLTETKVVNLDFPSVAANEMAELPVVFKGVKSGDTVIATPPSTWSAGWTWCAYVSDNDEVGVRIHNNSGGADNPAAADWRITVFKY